MCKFITAVCLIINARKNVQKSIKIFKPSRHNVVSTGTNIVRNQEPITFVVLYRLNKARLELWE